MYHMCTVYHIYIIIKLYQVHAGTVPTVIGKNLHYCNLPERKFCGPVRLQADAADNVTHRYGSVECKL